MKVEVKKDPTVHVQLSLAEIVNMLQFLGKSNIDVTQVENDTVVRFKVELENSLRKIERG